jgi:hypothetical protein
MVSNSKISEHELKRLTHDDGMGGRMKKRKYVTPECTRTSVFSINETSESFDDTSFHTSNHLHLDFIGLNF